MLYNINYGANVSYLYLITKKIVKKIFNFIQKIGMLKGMPTLIFL